MTTFRTSHGDCIQTFDPCTIPISLCPALRRNKNIFDNLLGYVHTSMWNLSTGTFRKLYKITDAPDYTHIPNYDIQEAIRKEEAINGQPSVLV